VKNLPNILSLLRLFLLAPIAALCAWLTGSREDFLILFCAALLTDWLDGFLARRFNAKSELGRKLDSWGDYATAAAGMTGVTLLWPLEVKREWPWFVAALIAYFIIVVYGLFRWRKVPGYHTWFAKAMAWIFPLTLIPLLFGGAAQPFHIAVILQILCGIEEMTIALILPGYSGEMPGLWHALHFKRNKPV
jgi:phosphatidylglycerophosphate synthase